MSQPLAFPDARRLVLVATLLLTAAEPALAASADPLPSAERLVAGGAKVGRIDLEVGNIFDLDDPREDRRLFHWVNRLHRLTRPQIVRDRLLFKEGDRYDPARLAESERLLRDAGYFYEVEIRPQDYDPATNEVAVGVRVRDVWSLKGGLKLGRSGGENSFGFGLTDDNFLGTGKSLKIDWRRNVDRNSTIFHYDDPAIGGSRWQLQLDAENNSDGSAYGADLELPFYAFDARRAFGVQLRQETATVPLYQLGEIRDGFLRERARAELYFGLSAGLGARGRVWRWLGGVTFEDTAFAPLAETGTEPGTTGPLPGARRLVYPFVGFSTAADRYAKTRDFDQIARTEDLQLGLAANFSLGYASEALGSDRDALILEGLATGGFELGRRQILLYDLGLTGRIGSAGSEDLLFSAGLRYHLRDFGRHLLVLEAHGDLADNLDRDHQLLLGGDSGLRGYPLRYQSGRARFLFTAEQRIYTDWYPFRLANVGAAVFFDLGRTWSDGSLEDPLARSRGWLADVGAGLRLSSSRTHHGSIIHLDLALPLAGDEDLSSLQFLIRTKTSF